MPCSPHYAQVAERAAHRCQYCLAPERLFNKEFEVEHVDPEGRGGPTVLENLVLACRACNGAKGVATLAVDPATGVVVALFHPLRDRWDDHFRLVVPSAMIEGKTGVGRATVERLGMNRTAARDARQIWIALGLYP
jgi:hypothetical protein